MPLDRVVVKAPASTANLGPGYDVFGLALAEPSDKVLLKTIPEEVKIEITGLSAETIPTSPHRNTAGVVANHMLKEFSLKEGIHIRIEKGILPGMGFGSSAASASAVAYGLNLMFDLKLDAEELIQFAAKGEIASAGSEHADNVSAAICGDFVIVKSYNPVKVVRLKCPSNLELAAAYPHVATLPRKTEKARSVVSKMVPIGKLVHNVGMAAAMTSGFASRDVDLIGKSMNDAVVEPKRASLIPGFEEVKKNAFRAGAAGVAISGAGPAMIAVVNSKKASASRVAEAMKQGFESKGLNASAFATKPGRGVHKLEVE